MAEVTAQLLARRTRADAGGLGDRDIAPLGIIRRLRHPRDGARRHCAAGGTASGTTMSHYFCRGLQSAALTLAVSALARRMIPRAAAAPLIAGCRLGAVASRGSAPCSRPGSTPDPGRTGDRPRRRSRRAGSDTADRQLAPTPPAALDSAGGGRHKGPAASTPQAHRSTGGPGLTGIEPGPSLYLPIIITKEAIPSATGQMVSNPHQGNINAGVKPARRQRGRRMRPSAAGAAGPLQPGRSQPDQPHSARAPRSSPRKYRR